MDSSVFYYVFSIIQKMSAKYLSSNNLIFFI